MVSPMYATYPDWLLLRYLKQTAGLLHEVGDGRNPYHPDEWNGVSRVTCYRELAANCDQLIAECEVRKLDWYEAYWGEPRPSPSST